MKNFPLLLFAVLFFAPNMARSADLDYRNVNELSPNDYLLGSHGKRKDPIFDELREVDLSIDVGIGADCGKMSVKNTMQAALKNVLDTRYLGSIGRDILAASPMLISCYFSPSWCSILKHSQIKANFLAQLRLDQCRAIDRYTDSRVSDFYEERARCVGKANRNSGGNFEESMESCKNSWEMDLADWSGKEGKTPENRLIESTAKWAGFSGKDAERVVSLTKAFIGDTIIKQGSIRVDYGPRKVQLTPRTYLMGLKADTYSNLCDGLVTKVIEKGGHRANVYRLITDGDLENISGDSKSLLVDRQTVLSLSYLPHHKRKLACKKLSDAIAMTVFTNDMGQTLDFATAKLSGNPHLPEKHKHQAINKARVLKDQIEMTLAFEENNSRPLNFVLNQINKEGQKYQGRVIEEDMAIDRASITSRHIDHIFFDCADGIGCIDPNFN